MIALGGLATTFFVFFKCTLQGSWWMLILYILLFIAIISFLWYLPSIIEKIFKSKKIADFFKFVSGTQLGTMGMAMALIPKTTVRADSTVLEAPGGVSILREYSYEEKIHWLTNIKELFKSNGLKPEEINLIFSNIDINTIQSYQQLLQLVIEQKRLVLNLITENFNNKNIQFSWLQALGEFAYNHPWLTILLLVGLSFYIYYIYNNMGRPPGGGGAAGSQAGSPGSAPTIEQRLSILEKITFETKKATLTMAENIIQINETLSVQNKSIIELKRLFKINFLLQRDFYIEYSKTLNYNPAFEKSFQGLRVCINYLGKCLGIDLTNIPSNKLYSVEFLNNNLAIQEILNENLPNN